MRASSRIGGNLPTALTSGGTTVQYRYSAEGQRTYKKEGTGNPEYDVLDGSATLAVVDGGSLQFWNVLTPSGETICRHLAADAVLDTNVLVAAIRSRRGASWRILDLVRRGEVQMHVTVPLVLEYQEVLLRHRQGAGWSRRETLTFLGLLTGKAQRHKVYYLWRGHAEDPEDAHVLGAAVASEAEFLVTFKTGDLTKARRFGVDLVTPGAFLRTIDS